MICVECESCFSIALNDIYASCLVIPESLVWSATVFSRPRLFLAFGRWICGCGCVPPFRETKRRFAFRICGVNRGMFKKNLRKKFPKRFLLSKSLR